MSKIEDIYYDYISSGGYKEKGIADERMDEFEKNLRLEIQDDGKFMDLSDAVCGISAESEKEGFVLGFKYAVGLMQECSE